VQGSLEVLIVDTCAMINNEFKCIDRRSIARATGGTRRLARSLDVHTHEACAQKGLSSRNVDADFRIFDFFIRSTLGSIEYLPRVVADDTNGTTNKIRNNTQQR
jgi:hypothetical protein